MMTPDGSVYTFHVILQILFQFSTVSVSEGNDPNVSKYHPRIQRETVA